MGAPSIAAPALGVAGRRRAASRPAPRGRDARRHAPSASRLTRSIQTVTLALDAHADGRHRETPSRCPASTPGWRRPRPRADPHSHSLRRAGGVFREGFAGARVARIARRAGINKRMLYHYFGNKEDLFHEILDRKLRERAGWVSQAPADLGESLAAWFQMACEDREFIRLIQWEALRTRRGPRDPRARAPGPVCARRRRSPRAAASRAPARRPRPGPPPARDPRPRQLPRSPSPRSRGMVTGRSPSDPTFRRQRRRSFAASPTPCRAERPAGRKGTREASVNRPLLVAAAAPRPRAARRLRQAARTPPPPRARRPRCR